MQCKGRRKRKTDKKSLKRERKRKSEKRDRRKFQGHFPSLSGAKNERERERVVKLVLCDEQDQERKTCQKMLEFAFLNNFE
jgi:hypothetical protein